MYPESYTIMMIVLKDDIALIAENENELQSLLNDLTEWCDINSMQINNKKSKIAHFRPNSGQKSCHNFICGNESIDIVDRYVYLGLT